MTFKTIIVSAPGKIILFGEHAVVYGKKAIATSLDLRTCLQLEKTNEDFISLILPSLNSIFKSSLKDGQSLQSSVDPLLGKHTDLSLCVDLEVLELIKNFLKANLNDENMAIITFFYLHFAIYHKCPLESFKITVESKLPLAAGLGSSASYGVCLVAALVTLRGNILFQNKQYGHELSSVDKKTINKWAFLAEKLLHGQPSGIDNSVATFGGAIEFKRGDIKLIQNMPKLKILLVNTNVTRNTKDMVNKVKNKHEKFPKIVDALMSCSEEVTLESAVCFQKLFENQNKHNGDGKQEDDKVYSTLNDLVDMAQGLLTCMGVSHVAIETALRVLQKHHLSGKLTGAGGGGCVFAFIPTDFPDESLEKVKEDLKDNNFTCFESCVGCEGVKVAINL